MSNDSDLKKLAYQLFLLARRDTWLGGKTVADDSRDWPRDVEFPWAGSGGYDAVFWTLSPEIILGGYKLRICISSRKLNYSEAFHKICVRIFVDGAVKHPGGTYDTAESIFPLWFYESWECKIARQEREDGGRTGPIDKRDLLIAEAKERLHGPSTIKKEPISDDAMKKAYAEIEATLQKTKM